MAKFKKKVVEEIPEPKVEVLIKEPEKPQEVCKDCKYWHRQMNSQYGLCKRRVLNTIQGSSLTEYGLLGKFAVMPEYETCGEFEFKK